MRGRELLIEDDPVVPKPILTAGPASAEADLWGSCTNDVRKGALLKEQTRLRGSDPNVGRSKKSQNAADIFHEWSLLRYRLYRPLLRPPKHGVLQMQGQYRQLHVLGAAGAAGQRHGGPGVAGQVPVVMAELAFCLSGMQFSSHLGFRVGFCDKL